jgi:two-component system response regulator AtoC
MRRLFEAAERVAPRDVTVLVRGETGTGKELVASMLHALSRRAGGPLVRFNCAAIPSELAEAELFGHAKGAFTGAATAREGFFARANGGTLVLDEVSELHRDVQAKLLRALQEGEVQPVGSGRVERVDVRVVACTNRDLHADVRAGRFREDLYYRLAVIELVAPPLRERREDIAPLAVEFARAFAGRFDAGAVTLSPELLERLSRRDWPGNVRELENAVARLVAMSGGGVIGVEALDRGAGPGPAEGDREGDAPLRVQVERFEAALIAKAIEAADGNQSEAARRLGVHRVTLIDKMKKYGLT